MKLRKNLTQVSTFFLYRLARILIRYPTSAIPNAKCSSLCSMSSALCLERSELQRTTDHGPPAPRVALKRSTRRIIFFCFSHPVNPAKWIKLLSLRALRVLRGNILVLLCGLGVLRGEMHLMPASVSACPVGSRLRRARNAEFHRVNLRLRQKWKVNG